MTDAEAGGSHPVADVNESPRETRKPTVNDSSRDIRRPHDEEGVVVATTAGGSRGGVTVGYLW
jgi:hypothetical protein